MKLKVHYVDFPLPKHDTLYLCGNAIDHKTFGSAREQGTDTLVFSGTPNLGWKAKMRRSAAHACMVRGRTHVKSHVLGVV